MWSVAKTAIPGNKSEGTHSTATEEDRLAVTLQAACRGHDPEIRNLRGKALFPELITARHYRGTQEDAREFILNFLQACPQLGACLDGRWEKEKLRCAECSQEREVQSVAGDQYFTSAELAIKITKVPLPFPFRQRWIGTWQKK